MPKALLSSFRTGVLLTLFFSLVCFLVFVSRALRRCRSPVNIFSTLTKNGRRLAELPDFSVLIADSIRLQQTNQMRGGGQTMDLHRETNIHTSILFSPLPPF